MTARGKIVLTILILGVVGFGVFQWWDKIAPQTKPQIQALDVAKVKEEIQKAKTAAPPEDITKLLLAGTAPLPDGDNASFDSRARLFFNTWLVTALNPKGIIFFVAFLPQFVNPLAATIPQLWILAATFVTLATLNAALYAFFARGARRLLMSPRAQRRFNIGGGSLLVIAGGWALSARQSA